MQRRLNSEEIVLPEFAMPEAEVDPGLGAGSVVLTTDDDYTVGTMKRLSRRAVQERRRMVVSWAEAA